MPSEEGAVVTVRRRGRTPARAQLNGSRQACAQAMILLWTARPAMPRTDCCGQDGVCRATILAFALRGPALGPAIGRDRTGIGGGTGGGGAATLSRYRS